MMDGNSHEGLTTGPDNQLMNAGSVSNDSQQTSQATVRVKQLPGWFLYVLLFLLVAGVTFFWSINLAISEVLRSWDLYDVGNDLLTYLEENNHEFPDSDNWCDVILEEGNYDKYYSFQRYDGNKDGFRYTLNKHVLGCHEIPDDMVILYVGESGWNQAGDIESVKNHDRLRVFLGDGYVRYFRKKQLPYLRWKPGDSGVIPEPDMRISLVMISALLVIVFLSLLVRYRACLRIFWILAGGIGATSAGAGAIFGSMAEDTYYQLGLTGDFVAPWLGSVWGFIVGASFIAVIGSIYAKYRANVSMLGYGTVMGAITGIVASSIIHAYLMIVYEEKSFLYLLAGSCFGVIAGLLLGWVSSGLIRFYKNHPRIQEGLRVVHASS